MGAGISYCGYTLAEKSDEVREVSCFITGFLSAFSPLCYQMEALGEIFGGLVVF